MRVFLFGASAMTAQEFKAWLEGYGESFNPFGDQPAHPSPVQWQAIKARIAQLDNTPMYYGYRPHYPYWYNQTTGYAQAIPGLVQGYSHTATNVATPAGEREALAAVTALGRAEAVNPPRSLSDAVSSVYGAGQAIAPTSWPAGAAWTAGKSVYFNPADPD